MPDGCAAYSPRSRAALPRRSALNRMPQKGSMLRRWVRGRCAPLVLAVCGVAISPVASNAQETPTVRTPPPQQIETPSTQPETTAKETDRYTLSHERYEKAIAYSRAGYALYFLSVLVGFAALLVFLRAGFAGRLRDFAQRQTENR